MGYAVENVFGNYFVVDDDASRCVCICTLEEDAVMIRDALNSRDNAVNG